MTTDRDALIRLAMVPADAAAPADLADAIYREVVATPQRRGLLRLGRFGWLPSPSPTAAGLVLLALLALAVLAIALAQSSRPILSTYHGGPDRTGVMPGPGPVGVPAILWDVARPGPVPFTSMPLPVGDRIVVADLGGTVAALDADTGSTIWELDIGSRIDGAPTTVGGLVLVGTEAGEVVAIDIASSRLAWRRQLEAGGVTATLLAVEDVIYAGTSGGRLLALASTDGHVLWSIDLGAAVSRGPAYADGLVYVPTHEGSLWAIDVASHAARWSVELAPGDVGTPGIVGDRVYVGRGLKGDGPDHDFVAMDAETGRLVWAFGAPDGRQVYGGALANGRVYAVSDNGSLYALDPATGEMLWASELGGRLTTLVSVVGETLYIGSTDRSIHAVDAASGRELWAVPVTGEPTTAAVVGGRVFVGTNLGRVVAVGGT